MSSKVELVRRAREYAQQHELLLGHELGAGVHGIVFATESQAENAESALRSAIKVYQRQPDFARERDVYFRLQELGIAMIRNCRVPQLLGHDDNLLVLEMTIVKRPFVLDFAGAYLDEAPDFSDEVMADWRAEKQEQFEGHWSEVQAILRELEAYGIYMLDINPGNISFGD
jgi:hypothetical protein